VLWGDLEFAGRRGGRTKQVQLSNKDVYNKGSRFSIVDNIGI